MRSMTENRILAALPMAALVTLVGCGGEAPDMRERARIGPDGGELVSRDGRVTITVPPGALTETVELTVEPLTGTRSGAIGTVYDIGPSGTRFAEPVEIAISYADTDLQSSAPESLRVVTFLPDQGDGIVRAARLTHYEHRPEQSLVIGRTEHLSEFGMQTIDVPVALPGVQWYHWDTSAADRIPLFPDCPQERRNVGGCGWNLEVLIHADNVGGEQLAVTGATEARNAGLTNIIRIDWTNEHTVPQEPADLPPWADNFLARATTFASQGLATRFIVGNEPPLDGGITADQYVTAFNYLYCRKVESGLDIDLLAAGPNAWIPGDWFDSVLANLKQVDGFAIHTYHDPGRCESNPGVEDPDFEGTDLCCGEMCPDVDPQAGEKRCCRAVDGWTWDGGFRYLHYQLRSIQRYWQATKPVYITEFNSNWVPRDNYRGGIVSGGFKSLRAYLADACTSLDMPRVFSLMWFVDSPNARRNLIRPGTWWPFALANIDSERLRQARAELKLQFEEEHNGGGGGVGISCVAAGGGGDDTPGECTSNPAWCTPGCVSDTLYITYTWDASGGVDLDTRTAVIVPDVNIDVGALRNADDGGYLYWSGDAQGASGSETVEVDLGDLQTQNPDLPEFRIRLRAFWYNAVSDRGATITISACDGNAGATLAANVNTDARPEDSNGAGLGVLVYRQSDGAFIIENPSGVFTCTQ